jgi:tetratricopeptide (TPR) repeat protein
METIVLANPAVSDAVRAEALTVIGRLFYTKGDVPGGIARYGAASELAHQLGDEQVIIEADQYLGFLTPDNEQAIGLLSRVIELAHQTGRKSRESLALSQLGYRLRIQGDWQRAAVVLAEGVRLARETGHRGAIAGALGPLGRLLLEQGDYTQARAVLEESIMLNRREGLRGWLGYDLENLAEVGLHLGDGALVRRALNETIPYYHRIDDLGRVARGLATAAGLARMQGRLSEAARLLGAASAQRHDLPTHGIFECDVVAEYNRLVPVLRAELAPSEFENAWAEGQRLTIMQAIQSALAV